LPNFLTERRVAELHREYDKGMKFGDLVRLVWDEACEGCFEAVGDHFVGVEMRDEAYFEGALEARDSCRWMKSDRHYVV